MSQLSNLIEVSPEDVLARLETGSPLQLVDVRQPWEYVQYHIPGVLLLPLGELSTRYAAELDPEAETICICEHGVRSANAALFLAGHGFLNVANMIGGMAEYHGPVEAGHPVIGSE